MKKILLTFAFLLTAFAGFAQTANDIVGEFKNEQGVEVQVVPKMMIQMGMAQSPDEKAKSLAKKIEGMTVMSLSKASDDVKANFFAKADKMTEAGYEKEEEIEESGVKVKTLIKTEDDVVKELVNIVEANGETVFILMTGKFSKDDLDALKNNM